MSPIMTGAPRHETTSENHSSMLGAGRNEVISGSRPTMMLSL